MAYNFVKSCIFYVKYRHIYVEIAIIYVENDHFLCEKCL